MKRVVFWVIMLFLLGTVQEIVGRFLFPLPDVANFNRIKYMELKSHSDRIQNVTLHVQSTPDNMSSSMRLEEYGFRTPYFRIPKPLSRYRITIIGDSIAEGFAVDDEQTFASVLRERATRFDGKYEVINLAISGNNLWAYQRLARDSLRFMETDHILLIVFANDLYGTKRDPYDGEFIPSLRSRFTPRLYEVVSRLIEGRPVINRFSWLDMPFFASVPSPLNPLSNRLNPPRRVDSRIYEEAKRGRFNPYNFNLKRGYYEQVLASTDFTRAEDLIEAVVRDCKDAGSKITIVYVPFSLNVSERYQKFKKKLGFAFSPRSLTKLRNHQIFLSRMSRKYGFEYIDLTSKFTQLEKSGEKLYYPYDGHLNPRGHAEVANLLYEHVILGKKGNYLMPEDAEYDFAYRPDSIDLIPGLRSARITSYPKHVTRAFFEIDDERVPAILSNPPAEITYRLRIPPGGVLSFGTMMRKNSWDKSIDGVEATILIDTDKGTTRLFRQIIDPKNRPGDRKLFKHSIDLSDWSGKSVSLRLITRPRSDARYDWFGWLNPQVIVKAKSMDVAFRKYAENPVLLPGPDDWDASTVRQHTLWKEKGTYYLLYSGWNGDKRYRWSIGVATSKDMLHWTKYSGNPILQPGEDNAWDSTFVMYPEIVKKGDTYYMFYMGSNVSPLTYKWDEPTDTLVTTKIGLATSKDLLHWKKYPDNPVFSPKKMTWNRLGVWDQSIINHKGKYVMVYGGNDIIIGQGSLGLAFSDDLIHWKEYQGNPILEGRFETAELVKYKDLILLFLCYWDKPFPSGKQNIGLYLSTDMVKWKPFRLNPVLTSTLPWEGSDVESIDAGVANPAVIIEDGKIKMLYYGQNGTNKARIGYAEAALSEILRRIRDVSHQ